MKLTRKIIIALILGASIGVILNLFLPETFELLDTLLFVPVGSIFLNLIQMLVVPIVFCSIALGVASLGDVKKVGRIGGRTVSFFLITTAVAIILAMALALFIRPGAVGNFNLSNQAFDGVTEAPSFVDTMVGIIPTNPISAMAEGNMLQVIFFAFFFGVALAALKEQSKRTTRLLEEINNILMYLITLTMHVAPFGTFALLASAIGQQGLAAMQAMALYMLTVTLALFLHLIIVYSFALKVLGKYSPILFFKKFFPAMLVAFSTSSSNATLPIAMKTAQENLGVSKSVSSFVQPLGATINMDGTAIMQGVATIFIAQAYGIDLTINQLLMVVLTAVLASVGTAGVPGAGIVMLSMVLQQVGLPVSGIALIIGIDRPLNMLRTAINVCGDTICAIIIDESEKKIGMDVLQEKAS